MFQYPVVALLLGSLYPRRFLGKMFGAGVKSDVNENVTVIRFETHEACYAAYVHPEVFAESNLVLFDGFVLEDGLPVGAQVFEYDYRLPGAQVSMHGPREIVHTELSETVKKGNGVAAQVLSHKERLGIGSHTSVTMERHLIAIPKGHTALGFRTKPRTLERQYLLIESLKKVVEVRALVK